MQSLTLSTGLLLLASSLAACGDSSQTSTSNGGSGTTTGDGGSTTDTQSQTLTGGGGAGGATGGTTASGGATGGTTATTGGAGGATGGTGGVGGMWPTCESKPADVPEKTIHEIWLEDPAAPTETWVSGAFVTAVSGGDCKAGTACQFFVQEVPQFIDLADATQRSIKVFASASTSVHFEGVAVGDQVDLQGWAWRYDVDGQNELLLQINLQLPGCFKKVGDSVPAPVTATLQDLSVVSYEIERGPVFVTLAGVSGKPHLANETFGLWTTGQIDMSPDGPTSLSPFFLTGAAFTGLTPEKIHDFTSLTGVFGLFVPPANPLVKYKELYVRTMDDVVIKKVQP